MSKYYEGDIVMLIDNEKNRHNIHYRNLRGRPLRVIEEYTSRYSGKPMLYVSPFISKPEVVFRDDVEPIPMSNKLASVLLNKKVNA